MLKILSVDDRVLHHGRSPCKSRAMENQLSNFETFTEQPRCKNPLINSYLCGPEARVAKKRNSRKFLFKSLETAGREF